MEHTSSKEPSPENYLMSLPVNEIVRASKLWHELVSTPNFWLEKSLKEGIPRNLYHQWKSFLADSKQNSNIFELMKKMLLRTEESDDFQSPLYMIFTQENIFDLVESIKLLDQRLLPDLIQQFKTNHIHETTLYADYQIEIKHDLRLTIRQNKIEQSLMLQDRSRLTIDSLGRIILKITTSDGKTSKICQNGLSWDNDCRDVSAFSLY